jgi:sugar lactone lactonase YvrE
VKFGKPSSAGLARDRLEGRRKQSAGGQTMRLPLALGSVALAAALAACHGSSGGGGGGPVPTTQPSSSPGKTEVVYVANATANTVTGYLPLAASPSLTISKGVSSPVALALDGSGDLFVANCPPCITASGTSSISFYSEASLAPARVITAGLSNPVAMAVASNGTLFVANQQNSSVTAYAKGSTTVAMTITNGVATPLAIALDGSGNLYVANGAFFPGTITVYSPSGKLLRTLPTGAVEGVALDGTGRVYASNCNVTCGNGSSADTVTVFAPNSTAVSYVITSGVKYPTVMALDSSDNLYVANNALGGNNVTRYQSGSTGLSATIDAFAPVSIAIDKNGIAFIADGVGAGGVPYNQLTEYQKGAIAAVVTNGIADPTAVAVYQP